MLVLAREWGLSALAADIAGILEERDPMPRGHSADLRLRLDALRHYREGHSSGSKAPGADQRSLARIIRVAEVWRRLFRSDLRDRPWSEFEAGRLVAAAFPERVALNVDAGAARFRLPNGRSASLRPDDPLADHPWLAIAHLDAGQGEGRIFLAAPIDPADLSHLQTRETLVEWDAQSGRLLAREETRIGKLVFGHRPLENVDESARTSALCAAVRAQPELLEWKAAEDWVARVMSLRAWRSNEEWPDLGRESLLERLEEWLGPFLGGVKKRDDFRRIDLKTLLAGLLPWNLASRLDALAPTHLKVPSGSRIALEYFPDARPPVLAVRLQEMFGQLDTPAVNEGRTPVMVHLLSPARRPVQVTQDLRGFWAGSYHDVRKDLRGRYPRHPWPEDPFTAQATTRTKKKPSS
jgi:ATP-dependent helicase HrpB